MQSWVVGWMPALCHISYNFTLALWSWSVNLCTTGWNNCTTQMRSWTFLKHRRLRHCNLLVCGLHSIISKENPSDMLENVKASIRRLVNSYASPVTFKKNHVPVPIPARGCIWCCRRDRCHAIVPHSCCYVAFTGRFDQNQQRVTHWHRKDFFKVQLAKPQLRHVQY